MLLAYESMQADPPVPSRRSPRFCGIPLDEAIATAHPGAQLFRVYAPA
ncbi:MAG: hypothetical protein H6651_12605 [Ardenticatenales bacterium]|nr:hypothetical protein [Ardenticatenales bacterium]